MNRRDRKRNITSCKNHVHDSSYKAGGGGGRSDPPVHVKFTTNPLAVGRSFPSPTNGAPRPRLLGADGGCQARK